VPDHLPACIQEKSNTSRFSNRLQLGLFMQTEMKCTWKHSLSQRFLLQGEPSIPQCFPLNGRVSVCVCMCVSVPLPLDLLEAFKTHQRLKLGHTEKIMQSNACLVKMWRRWEIQSCPWFL